MILNCLATTEPLAAVFSDASVLQAMLDFEAALARAQARTGVISSHAAEAICKAAVAGNFDADAIAAKAFAVATPAIPLVQALRGATEPEYARFVHWGATSQDVCDTAMVLLLRKARGILAASQQRIAAKLRTLSDEHAATPMLARTLLQPAPPITFGLKAAAWCAGASQGWQRLQSAFNEAIQLQFGGASGTLASLGEKAPAVTAALAGELHLPNAGAPWHTRRDGFAVLVCSAAIYVGALGKIARDIALLMQHEVGEASERGGGSSAMPHKRNPSGCVVALAAANRMPGLAATFLTGMIQEHERAAGAWQAESMTLSDAIQTTGAASAAMADVLEGLTINPERMRANIASTNGAVFSERAALIHGREAVEVALASGDFSIFQGLDKPEDYLGSAEEFRKRLLDLP